MWCLEDEPAGRLILVRHGESEGNRDRVFTHSPEVPLTACGREQARQAGVQIARRYHPVRIVASPFVRAWQTAQIVGSILGLEVEAEGVFREQSYGALAGQPYDVALADATVREGSRWTWRPPGGESLAQVSERVVPAFKRLCRAGTGQDVVVVSHGGVMLALCAHIVGTFDALSVTPNGGMVVVEHRGTTYRLVDRAEAGRG